MKFSQYNYVYEQENNLVIVNIATSKYVKIKDKEQILHLKKLLADRALLSDSDEMVRALKAHLYIVDDDCDEYKIVKEKLNEHLIQCDKTAKIFLYVTDQCNFRCVYCPEEHVNKKFSDENWDALYNHILNNVSLGKYEKIEISFFGGEPLLETKKIISFLEKLETIPAKYPNVVFDHSIITNGYLLTSEVYDKLVQLHVNTYQITVDGFADTHDKYRPLVGGQPSWDKIIKNLEYINTKEDGAVIILRTNYSNELIDSMSEWKKYEELHFKNEKFIFSENLVTGLSERVPEKYIVDDKSLEKFDLNSSEDASELIRPFSGICRCAYTNYYTISTEGKIAKCENIFNNNEEKFIGYLGKSGDFIFNDNYKRWIDDYEVDTCSTCIAFPVCCARVCPARKAIFPDTRPDCINTKKNFEATIIEFIKQKVLK